MRVSGRGDKRRREISEKDKPSLAETGADQVVYSQDLEGQGMTVTLETPAAALARLTDGLALIVCAAHALRAVEDEITMPDVVAEISALRQGIAAVQRAASDLGLALEIPPIAESGYLVG